MDCVRRQQNHRQHTTLGVQGAWIARRSVRYSMCLLLSLLFVGGMSLFSPAQVRAAASFPLNVGSTVSAPAFSDADIPPGIVNDGSTLWATYGDGGSGDPRSIVFTWERHAGATIDTLTRQTDANYASAFPKTHGDDLYWMGNIWRDPSAGAWYGLVHVEYDWATNYNNSAHTRRIMLAKSTDQGADWSNLGDIITPDPNYVPPAGGQDFGEGDQRLMIDNIGGYFYLYYDAGYFDSNVQLHAYTTVARCPISQKMAPGCWTKWNNGGWNQPGLGGQDGQLSSIYAGDSGDQGPPIYMYNSYLHSFAIVGNDWIVTASSADLATQNWSSPMSTPVFFHSAYNWPFDTTTNDEYTIGQSWRYYATDWRTGARYDPVSIMLSVYDAAVGFSSTQGQNQWRYQYTDGTTFTNDATYDSTNSRWSGPDNYDLVAGNYQHPGDTYNSVRSWVAPDSGSITIGDDGGTIALADSRSNGVNLKILKNGSQIWPTGGGWQFIAGGGSLVFPAQNTTVALGDQIQFVLARNGSNNYYDSTSWDPLITFASSGQTYQASVGFSSTQGQNQWGYQYSTNGEQSFQALNWDSTDNAWVDPNGYTDYCDIWQFSQHPNEACDSVRVWMAPSSGTVTLGANGNITVTAACSNNPGVLIRILKNGSQIWPASGWQALAHSASYSFPSGVTTAVNTGDQIQFVVAHSGSDNYCDSTWWNQTVTYTA